jgi:hypothetical protein
MKHIFLTMIFGLLSFCTLADTTNVTLHIGTVSAVRQPMIVSGVHTNSVTFWCEATLDNQTGAPLTATGLYSAFDGMRLVVLDASDKELARRGHADAFSTMVTQSFTLPVGKTTEKLWFPWCSVPSMNQAVVVRVEGGLKGSSYTGSITSNVVDVKIHK